MIGRETEFASGSRSTIVGDLKHNSQKASYGLFTVEKGSHILNEFEKVETKSASIVAYASIPELLRHSKFSTALSLKDRR